MPETGRNAQIQLNGGAAIVSYDPQKWGKLETDKEGTISLDRLVGAGNAAIIAEGIGIPSNVGGRYFGGIEEEAFRPAGFVP